MNKLLVAIPSPRDIPEVTDNWTTYSHDVIVVKYEVQHKTYKFLRDYFLEHAEYTHFCLMPDDLVVTTEQLDELWKYTVEFDLPVLSGVCPVDEDETRPKGIPLVIQKTIPVPTKDSGDERRFPREWIYKHDLYPCDNMIKVEHAGFPCSIISRGVMEKVSWRGSTKIGLDLEGNYDWQFSQDCKRNNIAIHVMPYVYLKHLRNTQSIEAKQNPKEKQSYFFCINRSV